MDESRQENESRSGRKNYEFDTGVSNAVTRPDAGEPRPGVPVGPITVGPSRKGYFPVARFPTSAYKKPSIGGPFSLPIPLIRGIIQMPLSGKEMLQLYVRAGWEILRQRGSHVRVRKGPEHETIPMHRELGTGMEKKLLKRLEETD